jgi:hypothetical protein
MKITLDHNCIIDLKKCTANGEYIRKLINDKNNEFFIVNIGASEMRSEGVKPERYDLFEQLLIKSGVENLSRIDPIAIYGVTFWDYGIWANDELINLSKNIESVLFGKINIEGKEWLNNICDVHTLCSHIIHNNDIFLTSDKNFTKSTKLPRLIELGAGIIMHPEKFKTSKSY